MTPALKALNTQDWEIRDIFLIFCQNLEGVFLKGLKHGRKVYCMNICSWAHIQLIFVLSEVNTILFSVVIGKEPKFEKLKSDLHYITVVLGKASCSFNFNQLEEPIFFSFISFR